MTIEVSLLLLFYILAIACAIICILQPRVWFKVTGILTIIVAVISFLLTKHF